MKNRIEKTVFGLLIIIWMLFIFNFSNQIADVSINTSGNTIRKLIGIFPSTQNLSTEEKEKLVNDMQPIVRKLAHFSIYTLGGIIIYNFFNTYDLDNKKKIIYSFVVGGVYAVSDELHQLCVPGRSGELRDVLIDSCGVLVGILIMFLIYSIIEKRKEVKNESINDSTNN